MDKKELIKLIEKKKLEQQNFIDAIKPISINQQIICDQATNIYNWVIEKLENLETQE